MKKSIGIASISGVVDKVYIPPSVLFKQLEQEALKYREKGWMGLPYCFGHDCSKVIGWTYLTHILLNDKAYLHFICNEPVTKEEKEMINRLFNESLSDRLRYSPDALTLKSFLDSNGLSEGNFIEASMMPCFYKKGIVRQIMPNLPVDDTGMIDYRYLIKNFECNKSGCFRHKETGIVLFADKHFKKSSYYMNSNNLYFFDEFDKFFHAIIDNISLILLKLDMNVVSYVDELKENIECEHWWGCPFSDDFSKLKTGVTVHRMKEDDGGRIFEDIERTEFYWYEDKNIRTLQIEEIKNRPVTLDDKGRCYVFKYLHSQADKISDTITHFDGSVRIYNDDLYEKRIAINIDKTGKEAEYVKLFRIDGNIPIGVWKKLINNYFMNNHLIMEYFENNSTDPTKTDRTEKLELKNKPKDINLEVRFEYIPLEEHNNKRLMVSSQKELEACFLETAEYIDSRNSEYSGIGIVINNPKITYFLDFYGKKDKVVALLGKALNHIKFDMLPSEYADALHKDMASLL